MEEANALVRFRMMRGESDARAGCGTGSPAVSWCPAMSRGGDCYAGVPTAGDGDSAERRLPAIIREAECEELEELIAVFRWFGNSEAMQIQAPEDHVRVPGLLLEEANALLSDSIQRRECYGPFGDAEPETRPPAPAVAEHAAPCVEPPVAASPAPCSASPGGTAACGLSRQGPHAVSGSTIGGTGGTAGPGNPGQARAAGAPGPLSGLQTRQNVVHGPEDQEDCFAAAPLKGTTPAETRIID